MRYDQFSPYPSGFELTIRDSWITNRFHDFTIRKSHKKRNSRITNMKFFFFRYIHNTSLKHKVTIQYWLKKFPVSCCAACAIFSSSIFLFDWKITGPDKIYQARLLALSQYRLFFPLSDLSHEAVSSRSVPVSGGLPCGLGRFQNDSSNAIFAALFYVSHTAWPNHLNLCTALICIPLLVEIVHHTMCMRWMSSFI